MSAPIINMTGSPPLGGGRDLAAVGGAAPAGKPINMEQTRANYRMHIVYADICSDVERYIRPHSTVAQVHQTLYGLCSMVMRRNLAPETFIHEVAKYTEHRFDTAQFIADYATLGLPVGPGDEDTHENVVNAQWMEQETQRRRRAMGW